MESGLNSSFVESSVLLIFLFLFFFFFFFFFCLRRTDSQNSVHLGDFGGGEDNAVAGVLNSFVWSV